MMFKNELMKSNHLQRATTHEELPLLEFPLSGFPLQVRLFNILPPPLSNTFKSVIHSIIFALFKEFYLIFFQHTHTQKNKRTNALHFTLCSFDVGFYPYESH